MPVTTTRFTCSSLLFEQILARGSSDVLWTRRFSPEHRVIRNRRAGGTEKLPTIAEQQRRNFAATFNVQEYLAGFATQPRLEHVRRLSDFDPVRSPFHRGVQVLEHEVKINVCFMGEGVMHSA